MTRMLNLESNLSDPLASTRPKGIAILPLFHGNGPSFECICQSIWPL